MVWATTGPRRKLGLDVLPLANGGRVVWVYETGKTFSTGNLQADPEELRGVKEGLGIRSKIGVPLEIGGKRRGMVMIAPIELRLQALRLMATRDSPSEPMLMEIERIFNSARRLRTLVSDLLDVARLDHGLFRIEPDLLDIVGLVQESAQALETPGANIEVRVQSTGRILVVADGARVRQCIDNLIANAVEKSPQGGTVTVAIGTETVNDGEHVRIQVIDEGPWVSPEILPRIFERHATTKGQGGGLGLGLFLAKRIAELHGGELSVESKPGEGARFMLSLPCQLHAAERSRDQ